MSNSSLRIVTYNVLADSYVRPEWYPRTASELLIAGVRQKRLIERVKSLEADVVCMQEVEPSLIPVFRAAFAPCGYSIEYVQKGRGKPDGCATLIRGRAQHSWSLHYDDNTGEDPSGHVALITNVDHGGHSLTIINTHLRWSPPTRLGSDHIAYRQVEELLRRCASSPMIVCGDLNETAGSAPIERLLQGGLTDVFADLPTAYTCNPNGVAKRIDYLLSSTELTGVPQPLPNINNTTALPSLSEPSDHLPVTADFDWA